MTDQELVSKVQAEMPLDMAMTELLCKTVPPPSPALELIESESSSDLVRAGLYLYVDDLGKSHAISQNIPDPLGSWWHAIMHRREGDFSNSKFWYGKAEWREPVEGLAGFDPFSFVDRVEADQGANDPELVQMQRQEWQALMRLCLSRT